MCALQAKFKGTMEYMPALEALASIGFRLCPSCLLGMGPWSLAHLPLVPALPTWLQVPGGADPLYLEGGTAVQSHLSLAIS